MKKTLMFASIAIFVLVGSLAVQKGQARAFYSQDLVVNGGFENDPIGTGWLQVPPGGNIGAFTPVVWHGGSRGALMGTLNSIKLIAQDVVIPNGVTSATFSGWYALYSDEYLAGYDTFVMRAFNKNDSTEEFCKYIKDPVTDGAPGTWANLSCDVTAAQGKTMTIVFGIINDSSYLSLVLVDDVKVNIEKPDLTAPTTVLSVSPSAPNGSNSYYTTIPTITLSVSDDVGGSGVDKPFYTWDGGALIPYAGPFAALEGTHTLSYISSDVAGNAEVVKTALFKVDATKPILTLVGSGSVTVEAGSAYTDSGVSATDNLDGAIVSRISTTNTVNTALVGTYTVTYNVSDEAGNAATAVMRTVQVVDTNKPSVNATLSIGTPDGSNGWYKTVPTITLSASDGSNGSGVDVIRYRWDGGGNLLYTGALSVPEGVHTLTFSAVDKAGNSSDEASVVIKVDATDLVLTLLDSNYQQTVNTASVLVKGTVIDNGSGIASVTVNGVSVAPDSSGNFFAKVDLKQGNNVITVVATDNAGRSVSASRTVVYKKGQVLGDSVVRPIIRKVSPNSTTGVKIASANQKVKVIGSNFKKGAKIKVGKLSIKTLKYRNKTLVEITIPLSKLKKGKYDVTVTNPDGQTMTVKRGFTKK